MTGLRTDIDVISMASNRHLHLPLLQLSGINNTYTPRLQGKKYFLQTRYCISSEVLSPLVFQHPFAENRYSRLV